MTATTGARRLERLPAPLVDLSLAVAVGVLFMAGASGRPEPGGRAADLLAYGLGAAIAGSLLVRRRWPLGVLVGSFVLLGLYHALDYPPVGYGLSLAVALFTATFAGHLRVSVITVVLLLAGAVVARVGLEAEPPMAVFEDTVREGTALLVIVFLAEALRARRALASEVAERMQRAVLDRERDADRRVAEERLRIARELHDVMAHTVAAITVQAGVAADVLDDDPAAARAALQALRGASREAMTELTATVGVLRADGTDGDAPRTPAPGLGELDALLATVRGAGVEVVLDVEGSARPLPAAVEVTAYRVVQESLTNVIRHAGAIRTTVTVQYRDDEVLIRVVDDGDAAGAGRGSAGGTPEGSGNGLTGMGERVTALGGQLEAGPRAERGFRVEARLPAARLRA